MTLMKNKVLETIQMIHDSKSGVTVPDFAIFKEIVEILTATTVKHSKEYQSILSDIKKALNSLNAEKIIRVGDVINDKYIELC